MSTSSGSQFDLNHWLLRVFAFIIDSIIVGVVLFVIYLPIVFSLALGGFFWGFGFYFLFPFFAGILEILYFVVMEVFYGETLGKKALGLQVRTVDGNKVTIEKSFIRNISKIYWLFIILDWLIAVITPGHDPRQKYTDRIAGTTVVASHSPVFVSQASSAAPPPPPPPPS
jgi:uncharacterized RDD family membrane protein YckC